MCCKNGIGDLFVSDMGLKERESALLDEELAREQKAKLLEYMDTRAMSSGVPDNDTNKYIILGGLAVLMLAVLILKS